MNSVNHKKRVYVVHTIDTEGPLYESLQATFDRLNSLLGIKLEPSTETLKQIQNKELDLNGKEELAAMIFSPNLINYNDTWEKVDEMLFKIMSSEFRKNLSDSFGNGYVFNWHCVDHVGYDHNPRRKDLGHHKIFDHYKEMIRRTNSKDVIHWHFHPMSFYKESNRSGTSFFNSFHLHDVLCRKIIERHWFPKVFRAGFHVERPDIHLFLEQWIPFDISNMSFNDIENKEQQLDLQNARFGNWDFAPNDWSIYHPNHDNYQLIGNCRRYIARVLNLGTRYSNIHQNEVDKAFKRANEGLPTLLGITNHDFRNMEHDIILFYEMLIKAKEKFPEVEFVHADAVDAFRNVIYGENHNFGNLKLDISIEKHTNRWILLVNLIEGVVFGPQPYLAIKTKSNKFVHENFDFVELGKTWAYTFDDDSIKPEDIAVIGIACNDKYSNTFVKIMDFLKQ